MLVDVLIGIVKLVTRRVVRQLVAHLEGFSDNVQKDLLQFVALAFSSHEATGSQRRYESKKESASKHDYRQLPGRIYQETKASQHHYETPRPRWHYLSKVLIQHLNILINSFKVKRLLAFHFIDLEFFIFHHADPNLLEIADIYIKANHLGQAFAIGVKQYL